MRFVKAAWKSIPLAAGLCVALATSLAAAGPSAADKESARAAWTTGMASRKEGRHSEALTAFEAAHALMGLPTTGIEVAREREALGLFMEALAISRAVLAMPAKTADEKRAQADAAALVTRVQPKIGSIEISMEGAPPGTPLRLRIDGASPDDPQALSIPANPGKHTLIIGAEGYKPVVRSVEVAEGAAARVTVELRALPPKTVEAPPVPPPPPDPNERWAWGPNARPSPGVFVHIDSNDPEIGLYRTYYQEGGGATMPGRWNGNQYTPGMTMPGRMMRELVCSAPCDKLTDGSYGDGFYLGTRWTQLGASFSMGNMGQATFRVHVTNRPSFFERGVGLTLLTLGATSLSLGGLLTIFTSAAFGAVTWEGVGMMLGGAAGVGLGVGLYVDGLGKYRIQLPGQASGSPYGLQLQGVF